MYTPDDVIDGLVDVEQLNEIEREEAEKRRQYLINTLEAEAKKLTKLGEDIEFERYNDACKIFDMATVLEGAAEYFKNKQRDPNWGGTFSEGIDNGWLQF